MIAGFKTSSKKLSGNLGKGGIKQRISSRKTAGSMLLRHKFLVTLENHI